MDTSPAVAGRPNGAAAADEVLVAQGEAFDAREARFVDEASVDLEAIDSVASEPLRTGTTFERCSHVFQIAAYSCRTNPNIGLRVERYISNFKLNSTLQLKSVGGLNGVLLVGVELKFGTSSLPSCGIFNFF